MIILVLNCGSSSLKYQLLDMKGDEVYDLLAKGLVERIGMEVGCLKHQATGKEQFVKEMPIEDHTVGIKAVLDALLDKEFGVLSTLEDIEAVGHRVVHGAEEFVCSQLITEKVVAQLEKCSVFAPLHNPANILGIKAVSAVLPAVPQVGVFDTAFHQTMPAYAYMYALPYEYYEKYGVRRYGFHGTSHKYVSAKGAKFAGLDPEYSKVITCHLGNGSSIAAVVNGKSIDTTMGFTPLEGLIMGTRCGNVDPDVVTYIQEKEGLSAAEMSKVMNKKSGLLGVSGVSSDGRDIGAAADAGNPRAKLALKKLTYDITKFIGAYAAAMSGPAMAVAIGYALKADPMVIYSLAAVGWAANAEGGAGGPLGKTLSNRPRNRCIGRQLIGRRTLEMRLKQSRLAAMMFKILYRQKKMLLSVVQTSVEVTESSLSCKR